MNESTVPAQPEKPVVKESESSSSENLKLAADIKREAGKIAELKKKNDQKDKFGKGKKGKKGKKGSVKNSPVKTKDSEESEVETETRCDCEEDCECERFDCVFCPCADFSVAQESLQCTVCYVWFHVVCANLRGLTEKEIGKLEGWTCCTWACSISTGHWKNVYFSPFFTLCCHFFVFCYFFLPFQYVMTPYVTY